MGKLLVVGSEGFIGKALVKRLSNYGHSLFTLDIKSSLNPNHYEVDIANSVLVDQAIAEIQPDVVIHLAAQIDVRQSFVDPIKDLEINGNGILNVLTSALNFGCKNFCYIHSGGAVYDSNQSLPIPEDGIELPQSPYGLTKNLGEGYVRIFSEKACIAWSSLALSNCYGPVKDHGRGVIFEFAKAIQAGIEPEIFGSQTTRDFVYVDDVIDAIVLAIEKPTNCRINIASSTETTLIDLYSKIAGFMNSGLHPVIRDAKFGEITRSSLSNSKAREILGWAPRTNLDVGLIKAIKVNS